jgi:2',3'-cyclic-nucleotide 2'-phosphodiesterase (5'-nucleotidase family)
MNSFSSGLTFLVACTPFSLLLPAASDTDKAFAEEQSLTEVTILHVNDSHGRYMPFEVAGENATSQTGDPGGPPERFRRTGRVGGFAYLATAVEEIRRRRGRENVLLIHSGDTFSDDLLGNLTKGEAVVDLMNALKFDFLALGNHDFDYGQKRTRALAELARFPMRAANVIDKNTGKPFLGNPTALLEAGGVRVGLLALGYHHTDLTTSPKNIPTLKFTSGIEAARPYVAELARRADVVVVASHLGHAVDRKLARTVEGIDLILGGHSHDTLSRGEQVGSTWIAQARSDLAVLGEVRVRIENGGAKHFTVTSHTLWNDRYRPDARFVKKISELRAPHQKKLEEVLATTTQTIGRNYMSESPFDVLVGQMLLDHTGAEVAMLPGIGYGVSLTPGPITREALYTLLPHPAKVATVRLSGAQLIDILEQSATNIAPSDPERIVGGLVQTAGMTWTVDLTQPIDSRIRDVAVDGKPIGLKRQYLVATQSGMMRGIHRYRSFARGQAPRRSELKLNDLVERAMKAMTDVARPAMGNLRLIR